MPLNSIPEDELRSICKKKVESMEYWLRRIIHEKFITQYGANYFSLKRENDENVIKGEISKKVRARREGQPERYSRDIDATLLDDLISILCNQKNYTLLFKDAFENVSPLGNEQLRYILNKIWECRNPLAHSNPISVRQAERLLCYSNDIIDSLSAYYLMKGEETLFNVPTILKYQDSRGNTYHREQMINKGDSGVIVPLPNRDEDSLRVGETLSVEVEIDQSFEETEYDIKWYVLGNEVLNEKSNRLIIELSNDHVGVMTQISCVITSKKDWHKCHGYDDELSVLYIVLPPF